MMRQIYFWWLAAGLAAGMQAQPGGLELRLAVPVTTPEGLREISMDRYPRLHVLLVNRGAKPVNIWKDWNTWGYFNLTLTWEAGGKTYLIRRLPPQAWDGDFPDFWTLPPGETLILEVDMRTGFWEGFPDLYGEQIPAELTAIYENKPDLLADEFGIWTGRIASQPLRVVFR
ncbi:MAG: hypothetical protein NW241_06740 [Bacteroidia bacterium]|nr:hypothetical protein [Bacteroidia bacterium]